jgi:Zn-dependent protease
VAEVPTRRGRRLLGTVQGRSRRTVRQVFPDARSGGRRPPATRRPSAVFLLILAVSIAGALLARRTDAPGDRLADVGVFLLVLGGWVVTVCLHEFAHAYIAYRGGDRSVESAGYLTLNPARYAHPVLSLLLPLLFIVQGGIGLPGGAVYLHRHSLRSRAWQSAAAAAGPLVNLVLAVALLRLSRGHLESGHLRFWAGLAFLGLLQLTATVLNLLPVPGLDGWAIIEPYLAADTVRGGEQLKPWGMLGVIVLLQVDRLNRVFFDLVYWLYDRFGADRALQAIGYAAFRFWHSPPL